jgi:hypothetical protein
LFRASAGNIARVYNIALSNALVVNIPQLTGEIVTTSSQSESRRVKSQGIKQYIQKEGIIQKVAC